LHQLAQINQDIEVTYLIEVNQLRKDGCDRTLKYFEELIPCFERFVRELMELNNPVIKSKAIQQLMDLQKIVLILNHILSDPKIDQDFYNALLLSDFAKRQVAAGLYYADEVYKTFKAEIG